MGTKSLEPKRFQELMKFLPLAPPTCKRFLAVLAALGKTSAAKAASPAAVETAQLNKSEDDYLLEVLLAIIVILLTIIIIVTSKGKSHTLPQRQTRADEVFSPQRQLRADEVATREVAMQTDPIAVRNVFCQSQCTYTAVRKEAGQFRFQPLATNSQGCWFG